MSHPLDLFRFCPVCGSTDFAENNFKSKHCAACGFTYYANPCSATVAFVRDSQGRLLVARRAKEPAKDTSDLPGGFVDMDETAEEGLRREIMEETGMEVEQARYLFSIPNRYLYSGLVVHTLDMFSEVRVKEGRQAVAADDVASLTWQPLEEVRPEDFGLDSIRQGVIKYLHELLRK